MFLDISAVSCRLLERSCLNITLLLRDYGITIKPKNIFWRILLDNSDVLLLGGAKSTCVKAFNSAWHHPECSPAATGFRWLTRFLARCGRVMFAWRSYKTWTRWGHFEIFWKDVESYFEFCVLVTSRAFWSVQVAIRVLNHVASSPWYGQFSIQISLQDLFFRWLADTWRAAFWANILQNLMQWRFIGLRTGVPLWYSEGVRAQ